jgi:hypothetical protein
MSEMLDVPALQGQLVRLEPLARHHAVELAEAAEEDRSSFGLTWGSPRARGRRVPRLPIPAGSFRRAHSLCPDTCER